MQNLCPQEVDIPTYHFSVSKIVGVSASRFMLRLDHRSRHGEVPPHYCTNFQGPFDGVLRN